MGCQNLEREDGCISIEQRACSYLEIEETRKIDSDKGGLEKVFLICTEGKERGEGEKLVKNTGPATERFLIEKGMTPTKRKNPLVKSLK